MIELTKSYKVGDKIFATFQEAQLDAMGNVFALGAIAGNPTPKGLAAFLIDHKDEVLAILSMSEPAKRGRKPRSDVGKPHRTKKAKATDAAPVESTVTGSGKYAGQ